MCRKTDFLALISVSGANPNGDPLCGGRPRIDCDGFGMMTDVCIKRKLRDRLSDMGESILVSPPVGSGDTLSSRVAALCGLSQEEFIARACQRWYDVRAFGQIFSFRGRRSRDTDGCTLSVRGPVSVQHAFSADPVEICEVPLTRCINGCKAGKRAADTFGSSCYVRYGLYVLKGSVNARLARKTGFSQADAELLKTALWRLFDNDSSAARPEGTMRMERLYWWEHPSVDGDLPTHAVHASVAVKLRDGVERPTCFGDYIVSYSPPDGLDAQVLDIRESTQPCSHCRP